MKATFLLAILALLAATAAPQDLSSRGVLAVVGARVYTSPDAPALSDATVIVEGGRFTVVGARGSVRVPADAQVIDGTGLTLTAGFWNSHVHFTDPQWDNAASSSAGQLSLQIRQMLTRYGYTSVFDTGSFLRNTLALRHRVESGDIRGPGILTAGEPFTARNGTPYYLKPLQLPELLTVPQATEAARASLMAGADAVKLFAGAILDNERDVRATIAPDLVAAVTAEAHRLGKPVFAHPQDLAGLRVSVGGRVDILAHVTELLERWPPDVLTRAVEQRMALIPTLKLLAGTKPTPKQMNLLRQVREFHAAGGEILFGTDVGFIPDYDPTEEYVLMQQAGMSARDILAALTVAPATRFRRPALAGRVAAGYEGDFVLLEGDPSDDVRGFARVRATVRAGRVIFEAR